MMQAHPRLQRQKPVYYLIQRHFHTEYANWDILFCHIKSYIESKCGLSDRRPCGKYYQIRSLKSAKSVVQFGKVGSAAAYLIVLAGYPVHCFVKNKLVQRQEGLS